MPYTISYALSRHGATNYNGLMDSVVSRNQNKDVNHLSQMSLSFTYPFSPFREAKAGRNLIVTDIHIECAASVNEIMLNCFTTEWRTRRAKLPHK